MDNVMEKQALRILFLASDPSDLSRTHLAKEITSVKKKIEKNPNFEIRDHLATKPSDVMNEIMNYKPHIVHFSGHGSDNGELCFEDENGEAKVMSPEALARLFNLATDYVKCVVVNTCYAEAQAEAIAQYIPVVVGTKTEISDAAAINFASGFYTALNPDLSTESLEKAYNLGCIAIEFDGNLTEHLTPVIKYGSKSVRFASEVDSAFSFISNPKGNAVNTLINGLTFTGKKMGLPDAEVQKIIDEKIWKLELYANNIQEYETNMKAILRDEYPLSDASFAALSYLQSGLNLSNEDVKAVSDKILSDPSLDSAFNWYDRGFGQTQLGNYELAIDYFTKSIEKDPNYSAAYSQRGYCYNKIKNYTKAIEDDSRAIDINDNWEISSNLILTYFDRGLAYFDSMPKSEENMKKALADWKESVKLNPSESAAYYNMGLACEFLKEYKDAIENYEKSFDLNYSNKTGIYTGIIKCYTELNDPTKLNEWTEKATKYLNQSQNGEPVFDKVEE